MPVENRPLVYFWIAEYKDGSAVPMFDPDTGKEISYRVVDETKVNKIGFYPFTVELAKKINKNDGVRAVPTSNPIHTLELFDGEKPFIRFERSVKLYMKRGYVRAGETVYKLGKNGKVVKSINEDGEVLD